MGLSRENHQIDSLPDQEKQGLQYIVGHMFHQFYKNLWVTKTGRVVTYKEFWQY